MTTPNALDRLRAADPAASLDAGPDEALLARLVAEPPTPPSRTPRRGRPRLLVALAAAAALAVAATIVGVTAHDPATLAERAYAQTAPRPEAVLHTKETIEQRIVSASGRRSTPAYSTERWQRGREVRIIITARPGGTYDQVLGPDGVLRNRLPSGEVQTVKESDGGEAADILRDYQQDPVTKFRRSYEDGALTDRGETTYHGRRARAYERTRVFPAPSSDKFSKLPNPGSQTTVETFYLDAETAAPLGLRTHSVNDSGTFILDVRLDVHEFLDPTPENLAKLTW